MNDLALSSRGASRGFLTLKCSLKLKKAPKWAINHTDTPDDTDTAASFANRVNPYSLRIKAIFARVCAEPVDE